MQRSKIEAYISLRYFSDHLYPLGADRDCEEMRHVLTIKADVIADWEVEENGGSTPYELKVGSLKFYLVRVGNAHDSGDSLSRVFDATQELSDVDEAIYDASSGEFNEAILKEYPDIYLGGDDLLIASRLAIDPLARGQLLGLSVLERMIEDWRSGCSLIVMKPYPLQFECSARKGREWDQLQLAAFEQNRAKAFRQLRRYYSKLDFQQVGKSDFFARCPLMGKSSALRALELPSSILLPGELAALGMRSTEPQA